LLVDGLVVRTGRRRREVKESDGLYMKVDVVDVQGNYFRVCAGVGKIDSSRKAIIILSIRGDLCSLKISKIGQTSSSVD
jgi:hypothetical protein